jgi:hypothetical protein
LFTFILYSQLVVSTLLKKGRQSFQELFGSCNAALAAASRQNSVQQQPQALSRQQLKQALLVLLQQNCVRTYLQPAEVRVTGVRPALYLYEADLVQILQVIRCAGRQACLQKNAVCWAICKGLNIAADGSAGEVMNNQLHTVPDGEY